MTPPRHKKYRFDPDPLPGCLIVLTAYLILWVLLILLAIWVVNRLS